jgi:hypothetical protein
LTETFRKAQNCKTTEDVGLDGNEEKDEFDCEDGNENSDEEDYSDSENVVVYLFCCQFLVKKNSHDM